MRQSFKVTQLAQFLRRSVVLSREQAVVLQAGVALRRAHGVQRDQYNPDEVNIVARARKLALQVGQISLSRFLVLRRRHKNTGFHEVTMHDCPRCGHQHREPQRRPRHKDLLAEEAVLRAARKRSLR